MLKISLLSVQSSEDVYTDHKDKFKRIGAN